MNRGWGPDPGPRPTPAPAPTVRWRWFTRTVRVPRAELHECGAALTAVAAELDTAAPAQADAIRAALVVMSGWDQ